MFALHASSTSLLVNLLHHKTIVNRETISGYVKDEIVKHAIGESQFCTTSKKITNESLV